MHNIECAIKLSLEHCTLSTKEQIIKKIQNNSRPFVANVSVVKESVENGEQTTSEIVGKPLPKRSTNAK